jgi:hypothetical protein
MFTVDTSASFSSIHTQFDWNICIESFKNVRNMSKISHIICLTPMIPVNDILEISLNILVP